MRYRGSSRTVIELDCGREDVSSYRRDVALQVSFSCQSLIRFNNAIKVPQLPITSYEAITTAMELLHL